MENQHNKTSEEALSALRIEIDKIDHQIISLLGQRMKVINQVGELKKSNNEKFFIRANREADMIKDLIKRSDSTLPKSTIVSIWRKIIATANMTEQDLKIGIHNPKNISDYGYLVREYYNDAVSLLMRDSVTNIVAEMEKGEIQIGIFALPNQSQENSKENWWINLANNKSGIKVFAKIPFTEREKKQDDIFSPPTLVAVAIKNAEKSSEDISLFCVEVKSEVSLSQISALFKEFNLNAKILRTAKLPQLDSVTFHLFEVEGFYNEDDEVIKNLSKAKIKPYIRVLGSYAAPIKI